jgi:carbon storage regulator
MLVLTRKAGEEIVIGENIHLTVVSIQGDKVRIGVAAPKEVVVDRREVHDRRKHLSGEAPALPAKP